MKQLRGLTCARKFFGCPSYLATTCRYQPTAPGRILTVRVEANELNAWGDINGPEEDVGLPDQVFELDTASSVCRLLTAKAVQHVLQQLGETDLIICQWLNNFAADNPPLRGDEFILKLMAQKPEAVLCKSTGENHYIKPQQLGNRVIAMRAMLATSVSTMVPKEVEKHNMSVLRKHLESHMYTSGSTAPSSIAARRRTSSAHRRKGR